MSEDKDTELDFDSDGSEQISENDPEDDFPINNDPSRP